MCGFCWKNPSRAILKMACIASFRSIPSQAAFDRASLALLSACWWVQGSLARVSCHFVLLLSIIVSFISLYWFSLFLLGLTRRVQTQIGLTRGVAAGGVLSSEQG